MTASPVASPHPVFPTSPDGVPRGVIRSGDYTLTFADSLEALDAALRLRFGVFNLELREGLDQSFTTGRDEDEFDIHLHHLLVTHRPSNEVVGTYRMQTATMAARHLGFYSAGEFDLTQLPPEVIADAVEIGRACVAREHRTGRVLHLLWRGLAEYLGWNRKRYLFGCCSLTSQDMTLGVRVHRYLQTRGQEHEAYRAPPLPELACVSSTPVPTDGDSEIRIPALFQSYLSLGAKTCGAPAIDRLFKTIDFLVLLDTATLDERVYRSFFG